jgi:hypothetical protein
MSKFLRKSISQGSRIKRKRDERDTLLDCTREQWKLPARNWPPRPLDSMKSGLGRSASRRTGDRDNPVTPFFLAQRWSELFSHSAADAAAQLKS